MTATETLDSLMKAIKPLGLGAEFSIHRRDALSLCGLRISDLTQRDFSRKAAAKSLAGLNNQNIEPLGDCLGVKLIVAEDAPQLADEAYRTPKPHALP